MASAIVNDAESSNKGYLVPSFVANASIGPGQSDRALVWIERPSETYDQNLLEFVTSAQGYERALDRLRTDPRFREIIESLRLDEIERRP